MIPPSVPRTVASGSAGRSGPEFEYLGGSVLTVIGQSRGVQYRFVGHGARVDPRDRRSLAAVPALREVNPVR